MPKKKKVAKKKAKVKKKVAKKKAKVKKKVAKKKAKVKKKVAKKKTGAKKKTAVNEKITSRKVFKKRRTAIDKPDFKPYQRKNSEAYMSKEQIKHFRDILTIWKNELQEEVERTISHMQEDASNFPDPADRATQEEEFGLELRTRDRERKLLKKII